MPLPRAFKTDESFLEKIAIGATGTRQAFDDLRRQGHDPIELERGSMSFKIWKAIKIKRVRVPDILCLRCGHRVESRAKTRMEISMSHSLAVEERGWDSGLDDDDRIALVHCRRSGSEPVDWAASPLVQYIRVESLRHAWRANLAKVERPKGAQEGFEVRVTWPAAVAPAEATVEQVGDEAIRYRRAADQRVALARLIRAGGRLTPLVRPGERVLPNQIVGSVVAVSPDFPCPRQVGARHSARLAASTSYGDRYTAVKALARFAEVTAMDALVRHVQDAREHVYVRVDAAAGLMRRRHPAGGEFLAATLQDSYLEHRLEAAIVLGEVATPEAAQLLIATVRDRAQNPEIRASAAWALGEVGGQEALPVLVESFAELETVIKVEAARALAKIARAHRAAVLRAFPGSAPEQRPGIAWALGKAGGLSVGQLLPALVDDDARHWIAYVIGTQPPEAMLPDIEQLAAHDREVYFAVTMLWKILASWVYGLEEY